MPTYTLQNLDVRRLSRASTLVGSELQPLLQTKPGKSAPARNLDFGTGFDLKSHELIVQKSSSGALRYFFLVRTRVATETQDKRLQDIPDIAIRNCLAYLPEVAAVPASWGRLLGIAKDWTRGWPGLTFHGNNLSSQHIINIHDRHENAYVVINLHPRDWKAPSITLEKWKPSTQLVCTTAKNGKTGQTYIHIMHGAW